MLIRALYPTDERVAFTSGDADSDDFIRRYAAQNQFVHRISTTIVAVEDECVVGYATFALAEVSRESLPTGTAQGLPAYPLPALRLGRLAVDVRFQSIGLGRRLLREVLRAALELRTSVGCAAVLVDALPAAVSFYEEMGFERGIPMRGISRRPGTVLMTLALAEVEVAHAVASADGVDSPRESG